MCLYSRECGYVRATAGKLAGGSSPAITRYSLALWGHAFMLRKLRKAFRRSAATVLYATKRPRLLTDQGAAQSYW